MDSNHRYPAPKAGAIAARRHPVQWGIIRKMENTVNTIWERLDASYPERISIITEPDPCRFLVTVMLSASTTDAQAVKAASALFALYPDPESVAGAGDEEIGRLIRSAGLWKTKAPRIREVSAYIAEHGLPSSAEELMKLPGIGEKTAACYTEHVFGGNAVIADTHFVRVARRLGFTDTSDRAKAAREIRERFPEDSWSRMSMVLNMHGRTVCRPRPLCASCPVRALCPSSADAV